VNKNCQKRSLPALVITAAICLFSKVCPAQQIHDMFTYQNSGSATYKNFIQSNVEGLFEGERVQKKISEQFALDMTQLQSAHKQFDLTQQDTVESSTQINLQYASQLFSRIQLGSTRQDIDQFNPQEIVHDQHQQMYSLAQGWSKSLPEDVKVESYLGVVQCSDADDYKYYPIFGAKLRKTFSTSSSEIILSAAQEVQSGGSYTGIYGNQIFRKFMAMGRLPLAKKVTFMWDFGYGYSEASFDQAGASLDASVVTMSASFEYAFNDKIKATLGYSQRSMFQVDQTEFTSSGPLVSASVSVASF
jgi:hypothetical protein